MTDLIALAVAAGATAATNRQFAVCLVTDAGSLTDPGVAQLAETGLASAEAQGVSGRVVPSLSPSADEASLKSCVEGGADLTIGLGYLMAGAVNAVATAYPHHVFVIVEENTEYSGGT